MGLNLSTNISQNYENYWEYCGILIPNYINSVPSRDKVNRINKNDSSTKKGTIIPQMSMSVIEYQLKYSKRSPIDGKLYWDDTKTKLNIP